jgi:hypothetical protein
VNRFCCSSISTSFLIREADLEGDECAHYSVQGGAEFDMVTSLGGSVIGFEFKHGDVPRITRSMRDAADDVQARRVLLVYPGAESCVLDEVERFVALAWRDLPSLRDRIAWSALPRGLIADYGGPGSS